MTSYTQLRSKGRSGHTQSGRVHSPIIQTAPRGVAATPALMQRRLGNRGTQAWLAEQTPVQQIQMKDQSGERYGRKAVDEELIQGQFASNDSSQQLQTNEDQTQNRTGMPEPLKAGLEQLSGMDLSAVRVHKNSSKPAQLNAFAFTQGQDIQVAPDQEKHLPHEGWHAVQQMQGRVQPTMQAKGVPINADAGLEREADVMGAKSLQLKQPGQTLNGLAHHRSTSIPRQARTEQELKPSGKFVQRAPKPIDEVKKVLSLQIEDVLKPGIAGANSLLNKKLASRLKVIDTLLKNLKPHLKRKWAKNKQRTLLADRNKSLKVILSTPDSTWVSKNHREQIKKAHKKLEQRKQALETSKKAFHQHDKRFASVEVVKVLGKKGFTAGELKALAAQESGDFSLSDSKGDIAGPAQIGKKETREVGHKEADRLKPNKFALVAAKVLIKKAKALEAGSPGLPKAGGTEYKKFVFAAYNAGQSTIIEAQKKTKTFKRDHKKWDDVVKVAKVPAGYDTSGLHEGIKVKLPGLNANKKYKETVGYVKRIFKRLA